MLYIAAFVCVTLPFYYDVYAKDFSFGFGPRSYNDEVYNTEKYF